MKTADAMAFVKNLAELKRASRAVTAGASEELGLNDTQVKVLRHVAASGAMSQAELARATEVDAALLGRALKPMLKARQLVRVADEEDARAYVIQLGPAGKSLVTASGKMIEKLAKEFTAPLSARDLADFERIVRKLVGR
ncbi:MAG: MarR family winged helix-turn-helix transcriptional regulator [Archangium sp.]